MTDILLRGISDDAASALTQKAQAAGIDRMAWIIDLLTKVAAEPIVRERYAYRFYGPGEARGLVRRLSNHVNGVVGGSDHCTMLQMQALSRAQDLMRRNEPGDQLKAYDLLKSHFDEVFEVPA
jgi:hypothetical protein